MYSKKDHLISFFLNKILPKKKYDFKNLKDL